MPFLEALRRWFNRPPKAELCILNMLAQAREPMYGLDMIQASAGVLKRGTIYVWLARLEERGLISSSVPGIEGRRKYRITIAGRAALP